MNKLNTAGTHVIDAHGKEWALETAHPMPLPDGIEEGRHMLFWYHSDWISVPMRDVTHWLLRTEPPTPKTQEELDEEACNDARLNAIHHLPKNLGYRADDFRMGFFAGVAYACSKP